MSIGLWITVIVIAIILITVIVNLFRFSLNDFLEKFIKKTLCIWLPFSALKRLSRQFREKYMHDTSSIS